MPLTSDWHIHSRNSCDEASLTMGELVASAARDGIREFGITDHIHTPYNLPDLYASREEYLSTEPQANFHFGVEVSCVSRWELEELARGSYERPVYGLRQGGPAGAEPAIGLTAEDIANLGIEYVVAGTHWPLYCEVQRDAIIRDYHRQNIYLAAHPLVDIVAHPWWWMGHWRDDDGRYTTDPWLDDFGKIPLSMHDEFAAALIQHSTAAEVNISANLLNPGYPDTFPLQYLEYLAGLKERGVMLTLGSDCHSPRYEIAFERAEALLATVGITDADLGRPPGLQGK